MSFSFSQKENDVEALAFLCDNTSDMHKVLRIVTFLRMVPIRIYHLLVFRLKLKH